MDNSKGSIIIKHEGRGICYTKIKGNPPIPEMLLQVLLEGVIEGGGTKENFLEEIEQAWDIIYKAIKEKK